LGGATSLSTEVLDTLLGWDEPFASFHDASVTKLRFDPEEATLEMMVDIFVGDPDGSPDQRELQRPGRLLFTDVVHWSLDAAAGSGPLSGPLWLTASGRLDEARTLQATSLASRHAKSDRAIYLFFSDLNTFAYCIAGAATFQWTP
jgi:hypothetical protein